MRDLDEMAEEEWAMAERGPKGSPPSRSPRRRADADLLIERPGLPGVFVQVKKGQLIPRDLEDAKPSRSRSRRRT